MSNVTDGLHLRLLKDTDPYLAAAAFRTIGWIKPVELFQRYLAEQTSGTRTCWVADLHDVFAGYITIHWEPTYPGLAEQRIPEIQDLNVLPSFRRKGVGTALLDQAEADVACRSDVVGLGVGLHPGYIDAHRLYAKRGYIPDGRGVTYRERFLSEGEQVVLDDDLLLHLVKNIRP